MDKEDLQSLLRQAAMIPGVEPKPEIPEEVLEKAVEVTEYNMENKWDKIREAMEGPFAERFLREMEGLSGREFIRVYGKMIEYFKPKIIRVEGERKEEEENVIRIEIHNSQPQQQVIDITHEEEESNGTE